VIDVFWSSEDLTASVAASETLRDTFAAASDLTTDYFAEYFESDRFPGAAYEEAFRDYLARKYAGRPVDVIIAHTDAVLRFLLRHRATLFPDAAIVHNGVVVPDPETSERGAGVTSLISAPPLSETLTLALRLHPSAQRVHVIAHAPGREGRMEAMARSQLRGRDRTVPLEFPQPATLEELLAVVRAVPPHDVIVYVRWSSSEPGRSGAAADGAGLVAGAARAPVYVVTDANLGSGAVGGAIYSVTEIGRRLAETSVRILRGVRAQDIPNERLTATPTFDARQLARWNIAEAALPASSRILFRDVSGWVTHKWLIAGAVGFVGLEALMIGALVLQRSRRRESEARNQAILRCLPDLMFLQTADGVFLDYYSRDPAGLLHPPETFLGRPMRDVLPPEMVNLLEDKFRDVFASDNPGTADPVTVEYEMTMPNGLRHYEARLVACDSTRVLSIVRDITDRKRADEELRRTQEELATASKLSTLGEFTASIAHELNQPLAVVTMNANLSLRWTADGERRIPQIRAALQDVVAAAARATDVVKHARKVYQHRSLEIAPLDVAALISGVCDIVKRRLRAAGVGLELDIAGGLVARADAVALRGVLLNLIVNAAEAMEQVDRGRRNLTIRARLNSAGSILVSVIDTGPGVPAEMVDVLFRTGQTTKPDGMGIGLSTSRAIVEAHGGRIGLTSNDASGATFTFTIPAETAGSDTPAS
jgi:signal transduction histidine kinase